MRIPVLFVVGLLTLASAAQAQPQGSICGGVFTAGGGQIQAGSGETIGSALAEGIAGVPDPIGRPQGTVKSGYLYRECSGSVAVAVDDATVPSRGRPTLDLVRPNPFNPRATLRFTLTRSGAAKLELYDAAGRRVRTLLERSLDSGTHTHSLDASNLASGVYYLRLTAEGEAQVRRAVLVK